MNAKSFVNLGVGLAAGLLIGVVGIKLTDNSSPALTIAADGHNHSDAEENGLDSNPLTQPPSNADWCVEHRIPESVCTLCNPSLIEGFKSSGDWCGEHQLPESACRICNPGLTFVQEPKFENTIDTSYIPSIFYPKNADHCATSEAIIQFASAETAIRAGLTCVPALEVSRTISVEAPAEVLFDESRAYALTSRIEALVVRWLVEPGERIKQGQALAELESPEMPALKAQYLEALAEVELRHAESNRADSLRNLKLISAAEAQQADRQLLSAQAQLSGAIGQLTGCGLSAADLESLKDSRGEMSRWLLRAANGGVVLERSGQIGQLVEAGFRLALIGDPSVLWIEGRVREADVALFHKGQLIEFATDGGSLGKLTGQVIWVSQFIDSITRTATIRAEIPNKNMNLVAHQFGRMILPLAPTALTVAIPRDAVQWEGCCNVVFVQEAADRYRPHKVTVTRGEPGYYNISSGLKAGEMVVVNGSYLLKTELRKGSLGAGCCGVAEKS